MCAAVCCKVWCEWCCVLLCVARCGVNGAVCCCVLQGVV